MYVAFWGLLFTVDFISVHDIQIYVWQQWNDAFEQHLFALFWPKAALLSINDFHDKVELNLDLHCLCMSFTCVFQVPEWVSSVFPTIS